MCSLIILRRLQADLPLVIAANRDEMNNRPWLPPARHWPEDHPHVVAGLDQQAGGSWMGFNDDGLVAAILNRRGSLGRQENKRSRGELVLEALDHAEAQEAAAALKSLNPDAYRPFNLIIADHCTAHWIRHDGTKINLRPIPEGLSMIAHADLNAQSPRIVNYRSAFMDGICPGIDLQDWKKWQALLCDQGPGNATPDEALCFARKDGFQTLCSSLLALPSAERHLKGEKPQWIFNDAPLDKINYQKLGTFDIVAGVRST